ncbi:hypothetical protein OEM_p100860 (plasmid) [Mycobacterium intracellulare subsp. yongonense 05-1390]|nr:hypothetical protein OEM_p100860 [Mycobacterium intracellulare subsp. yongonense 05-1390]
MLPASSVRAQVMSCGPQQVAGSNKHLDVLLWLKASGFQPDPTT